VYPDQVKVQISMASGTVVGAECSQYLMNHRPRAALTAEVTEEEARQMLSPRLEAERGRLSLIPQEGGERLCWGFEGMFAGSRYYVFVDAVSGEAAQILQVAQTPDGEAAI
ncbi:MAG: germination protein YpeB, partial [Clostridia bacterium]|nr:germination protein YpeB [Clostridia bacterium]